jgi:D-3-phosphoglycerate dehydrogenase
VLADNNVNVIDMMNRSRNDLAYNIIDVEQMNDASIVEAIAAIEHVKSVRLID